MVRAQSSHRAAAGERPARHDPSRAAGDAGQAGRRHTGDEDVLDALVGRGRARGRDLPRPRLRARQRGRLADLRARSAASLGRRELAGVRHEPVREFQSIRAQRQRAARIRDQRAGRHSDLDRSAGIGHLRAQPRSVHVRARVAQLQHRPQPDHGEHRLHLLGPLVGVRRRRIRAAADERIGDVRSDGDLALGRRACAERIDADPLRPDGAGRSGSALSDRAGDRAGAGDQIRVRAGDRLAGDRSRRARRQPAAADDAGVQPAPGVVAGSGRRLRISRAAGRLPGPPPHLRQCADARSGRDPRAAGRGDGLGRAAQRNGASAAWNGRRHAREVRAPGARARARQNGNPRQLVGVLRADLEQGVAGRLRVPGAAGGERARGAGRAAAGFRPAAGAGRDRAGRGRPGRDRHRRGASRGRGCSTRATRGRASTTCRRRGGPSRLRRLGTTRRPRPSSAGPRT